MSPERQRPLLMMMMRTMLLLMPGWEGTPLLLGTHNQASVHGHKQPKEPSKRGPSRRHSIAEAAS